jgi:hypothetical protein
VPLVLAATAFDSRELVFAADDLFGTDIRNTLRELRSRIEKSDLYKGPYKHLAKLSNMADSITRRRDIFGTDLRIEEAFI